MIKNKSTNGKKVWILTGNEINWEIAVSEKIWGVREGRLKTYWNQLEKGDILLFYAKSPVGGLIGLGLVESKFRQDKPLWPDETRENKVIYPYRFGFTIIYYLPEARKERNITIADLKPSYQAGINPLNRREAINEILKRIKEKWDVEIPFFSIEEDRKEEPKEGDSLHKQIRDKLYTIGLMEGFISEREYPIDGEKLDVAWRKVARGVPTKVFEVQIGGSIHQAMSKLKHTWDLWNSEPFLIIDAENRQKTDELLSGTFHEMARVIKVIGVDRVEELYAHLISDRKLFEEFGL